MFFLENDLIPYLQIPNADLKDAGEYYCIVRNGFTEVHSNVAVIQVTGIID